MPHAPVLSEKVIEYLAPRANQNFIDCTLGNGGHALSLLEKTTPKGKLLGIDQDPKALGRVKETYRKEKQRVTLVHENFTHLADIAGETKFKPVHGVLFDLGLSTEQLQDQERGFSFQKQGKLDMRFNPDNPLSAEKIVNFFSKQDLERILKEYGEEQFARKIAEAIVRKRAARQITKTTELVDLIKEATPAWYQKKKIHPATKTFQALRIAVNDELENLRKALPQAEALLEPGGRVAVISFHSLEDRIVKEFFKNSSRLTILTKKPIGASAQEIKRNPRSRSARLRASQKTS